MEIPKNKKHAFSKYSKKQAVSLPTFLLCPIPPPGLAQGREAIGMKVERGEMAMAYSDQELLARIIQCEAGGEGESGMKAVASVVMNRVEVDYGEYGRLYTIREVVFQKGQFTCAMETVGGQYNMQNIYNMRPTQVHYDIANWAMAGNRLTNLGFALWFYNPFSVICRGNFPSRVGVLAIRIGDHCFYNPTEAYALT